MLMTSRMRDQLIKMGAFPHKATFQSLATNPEPSGQPSTSDDDWSDVAGLVDLPCRVAPLILDRPTSGEERFANITQETTFYKIGFTDYYPNITAAMRVVVNGAVHNVIAIEADGNNEMTRIKTEIHKP